MGNKKGPVVARLDTPMLPGSIDDTIKQHTTVSFGKMSKTCKHHVLLIPKISKYGCKITKGTCNKNDCPRLNKSDDSNKHNRDNKRYRRRLF